MVSAGSQTEHASVVVLPESAWAVSDSSSILTAEASVMVREARGQGMRVLASVPATAAARALEQLWSGRFDGIIVPAGALPGVISRPEESVVLADRESNDQVDGALVRFSFQARDWDALDSLFVARAPTVDRPGPARQVAVLNGHSVISSLFLPGAVYLETGSPGEEWGPYLAFRANHPAVGRGIHQRLEGQAYAFYRGLRTSRDTTDEVVVVLGAEGTTRVKVSRVFDDDTLLRDVLTGKIALVSYGQVTFQAGPSGRLLIEVVE
jgi:hypothetical protein